MKLYGHPMSTCTRKVLTTLAEKNVPHEFVVVDLTTGQHKQPEHLARQPFGVVPAIDDDGFKLYEARAIIRYIDESRPGTSLTPKDAKGRALMEQWISVEVSYFSPNAMSIVMEQLFKGFRGGQPDLEKVAKSREALATPLKVLDTQLARSPFLAGETFTLADITFMPYFEYLAATPSADVLEPHSNIKAWWEKIRARPSWQKASGAAAAK